MNILVFKFATAYLPYNVISTNCVTDRHLRKFVIIWLQFCPAVGNTACGGEEGGEAMGLYGARAGRG